MKNSVTVLLVLGLVLLALAELAPRLSRRTWNDSLAAKLQTASENYHAALHGAFHHHAPAADSATSGAEEARQEYEKYQSILLGAQSRGVSLRRTLRWLGIVACGISLVLHVLGRLELGGPRET